MEVFVAILGCSQLTYVEAVDSQKKSTIITSQIPVKEWYDIIGEKTIADAILDRIVHHSLRVELHGESLGRNKNKTENGYL